MWYDCGRTKEIAKILHLVEVGANNGWMDPSDGKYYKQTLEKDECAILKLTLDQRRDLEL